MRRIGMILLALTAMTAVSANAGAESRPTSTCLGHAVTIVGTGGDDIITGTGGDDIIDGRGGNDVIDGRGGDDIICGGAGNDLILGGLGNDLIDGGAGADEIRGGSGDDRLLGGPAADTIYGDSGHDLLVGNHGNDLLDGGSGSDELYGGADDDELRGRKGNDVLDGGSGTDRAAGGPGIDRCSAEDFSACEHVALAEGDRGNAVRVLQSTLRDHKLYRGRIDGVFDRDVAIAVATFHKAIGPAYPNPTNAVESWRANPPSEAFALSDWDLLLAFTPTAPKDRNKQPDRVEVDIGRQLLYLILDGEVDSIVHVSTGYYPGNTPRTTDLPNGGYFWYQHPYDGWSPRPGAWSIYKFWAYMAGDQYNYGIHGYRDVPYWPASHGCTRVHVWEADHLHSLIFLGMPMHVWDE